MMAEINYMVGGEAGQGVQTVGFILAKTMSRTKLHVFADQDYESRVRGGHNFYRVRASDRDVQAISEKVDILISIDRRSVELHQTEVKEDGVVIFDRDKLNAAGIRPASLDIPLEKLAEEMTGNKLMANSVAVGAAIAIAGFSLDILTDVLREHFAYLGDNVVQENIRAARAGYDQVRQHSSRLIRSPIAPATANGKMLLNGSEAIALGAMAAGCKFMAAYPMTPTSSIMEYIAEKGRKYNIVMIQPEDEISALNMVVGAAFTGVRAMTATSGGGFCLMVEALSLAGMTETPIVAVLGQRPGPAIGLPTRTEQGELLFAIYAGHGEFPRAVLSPITIDDCFYSTARAFNLAEKYQTPVIIITDQHLASSYQTVNRFDLKQVKIDRGQLLSAEEVNRLADYKRHAFTDSGISPRAIPLQGDKLVVTDSDEHDESGHMIEDAETRTRMMQKRLKKLDGLRSEVSQPHQEKRQGAELTLIGWGSTYGAINEAADLLEGAGMKANVLQLNQVWPFPAEAVASSLDGNHKSFVVENNATGQLAQLIRQQTGIKVSGSILKFDGRPFSPQYIISELEKEAR
jgi:2-oxoglutarate ferredoxin oxidoreductase subunit alpha